MSFTETLYNLVNKSTVKYKGCLIEVGYGIWFWNGHPYLSLQSAKDSIDSAALALKNSIK